jgi:4-diphosphocytidyl-2C-methyl-D-erythritol kinase
MNNTERTNKLVALSDKIRMIKDERSRLEGTLTTHEQHLKNNFNLNSVEEAEKFVEEQKLKADELEAKLDKQIPELEKRLSKWM